jgi:hypothetical protein
MGLEYGPTVAFFFKLVSRLLPWMLISLTNKIRSIKQLEGKENDLKNQQIYAKAV